MGRIIAGLVIRLALGLVISLAICGQLAAQRGSAHRDEPGISVKEASPELYHQMLSGGANRKIPDDLEGLKKQQALLAEQQRQILAQLKAGTRADEEAGAYKQRLLDMERRVTGLEGEFGPVPVALLGQKVDTLLRTVYWILGAAGTLVLAFFTGFLKYLKDGAVIRISMKETAAAHSEVLAKLAEVKGAQDAADRKIEIIGMTIVNEPALREPAAAEPEPDEEQPRTGRAGGAL